MIFSFIQIFLYRVCSISPIYIGTGIYSSRLNYTLQLNACFHQNSVPFTSITCEVSNVTTFNCYLLSLAPVAAANRLVVVIYEEVGWHRTGALDNEAV